MRKESVVVCDCCGEQFVNNNKVLRLYFRRYSSKEEGYGFHNICKKCEDKDRKEAEWKDGLLKCHICGEYLPVEEFGASNHYPYRDNHDARCRKCRTKLNINNKKSYSDEDSLYKILLMRYLCARDRANRNGLEFNITKLHLKDLWDKLKGLCAISNIPMTYKHCNGRTLTNVSIDLINPHEGYTIGNIQLVCMAVNLMKSDLSMEELYMFCEAILKHKNKCKEMESFQEKEITWCLLLS